MAELLREAATHQSRRMPIQVAGYLQHYLATEMIPRLCGVLRDGGIDRFVIEQGVRTGRGIAPRTHIRL